MTAQPVTAAMKPRKRSMDDFRWNNQIFKDKTPKHGKNVTTKFPTKVEEYSGDLSRYIREMIDSDNPEQYDEQIKILKNTLNIALHVFEKHGIAIEVDEMRPSSWRYTTFRSSVDDVVCYRLLWKISFQYASLIWLKRHLDLQQPLDYLTLYLMKTIDNNVLYSSGDIWTDPISFRKASDEFLIKRIDGSSYRNSKDEDKEVNPIHVLDADHVDVFLLLPRMDVRLMKLHEELFNIFLNKDVDGFKAIIKA